MTLEQRVRMSRLIQQINRKQDYAKEIGISYSFKQKEINTDKSKITKIEKRIN